MLIDWKPKASEALLNILGYIEERNPIAADDLQATIESAVDSLPDAPNMGRPGRVPKTRELVVTPNYIVVYRVRSCIEVLNVLHAKQRYPKP